MKKKGALNQWVDRFIVRTFQAGWNAWEVGLHMGFIPLPKSIRPFTFQALGRGLDQRVDTEVLSELTEDAKEVLDTWRVENGESKRMVKILDLENLESGNTLPEVIRKWMALPVWHSGFMVIQGVMPSASRIISRSATRISQKSMFRLFIQKTTCMLQVILRVCSHRRAVKVIFV